MHYLGYLLPLLNRCEPCQPIRKTKNRRYVTRLHLRNQPDHRQLLFVRIVHDSMVLKVCITSVAIRVTGHIQFGALLIRSNADFVVVLATMTSVENKSRRINATSPDVELQVVEVIPLPLASLKTQEIIIFSFFVQHQDTPTHLYPHRVRRHHYGC